MNAKIDFEFYLFILPTLVTTFCPSKYIGALKVDWISQWKNSDH